MVQRLMRPGNVLFFLVPLVAAGLLGTFFAKQQNDLVIPIGIVDEDSSDYSSQLIQGMKQQDMIVVNDVPFAEADKLLGQNELDSVFVIKSGFQEQLLEEEREKVVELWTSPQSVASGIVQEVVASEVTKRTSAIKAANRLEQIFERNDLEVKSEEVWQQAYDYTLKQWEPEPLMTIEYVEQNGTDRVEQTESSAFFVPYIGIWSFFTLLVCLISSDWIVKERHLVFARIMTTYKGLRAYLLQTVTGFFLFQSIQTLLCYFVFTSLGWIDNNLLLLMRMIFFVGVCQVLSVWFASFFTHLGNFYVASILLAFLLAIFGGSFFPIGDIIPRLAQVANLLPQQLLVLVEGGSSMVILMLIGSLLLWEWAVWRLRTR